MGDGERQQQKVCVVGNFASEQNSFFKRAFSAAKHRRFVIPPQASSFGLPSSVWTHSEWPLLLSPSPFYLRGLK